MCYHLRSQGIGRIFDRLKILTGHFVYTGPFNIFALFTRNFERISILIFGMYGTPKRTKFETVENSSAAV